MAEATFQVLITDEGRAGGIDYVEGELSLHLWWEFTMDGAYIWAPPPDQWDAYWASNHQAGAAGRRDEILQRVASETVRKRAQSAAFTIDDDGINLKF